MKSLSQDPKIKTSCKNCIASIYNENTQTGCAFNRIEKFGDEIVAAYDDEKEFYVIKRFCNYYRSPKWNDGNIDIQKIKHQSSLSIDVIINCDDIETDIDRDDLIKILKNINYYEDKLNIILLHSNNINTEIRKNIFSIFCNIKCSMVEAINLNEYLHSTILSSKSTYHIIVDVSNKSMINSLYRINEYVNDDLQRGIIFNFNSAIAISNVAYRIESLSNDCKIYENNIQNLINKSLESKLYINIL